MSSQTAAHVSGTIEGGRFDFNDGGSYVGEWADGRAHGLGIATGPEDNPGEYAGEWMLGFESLGVYVWPNGSVYEGRWTKGKRHGEGVQLQGRWRYKGEFTTGFCGRYGVRECLSSCAKYEGSWNLNQFDGFGIETSSDGSTYAGGWTKGLRSGLGVRKSVPYGLAAEYNPDNNVRAVVSQNSMNEPEITVTPVDNFSPELGAARRLEEQKNGFVLTGKCVYSGTSLHHHHHSHHPKKGLLEKSTSLFHLSLFRKLRKQKSTGDLHYSSNSHKYHGYGGGGGGSLRSTMSVTSQATNHSVSPRSHANTLGGPTRQLDVHSTQSSPQVPFSAHTSSEPINPNVTESYSGQWLDDKRTGYGVAERSDGLRYEGEWLANKKNGYGCTTLPDGSKEEGRYRNNLLVTALNRKNKLSLLRHSRLRDCVDAAILKAQQMVKDAQTKAQESANQRAQTARLAAESAEKAAKSARRACELARAIAHEFASDFVQPGHIWERNRDAKGGGKGIIPLNNKFSSANTNANTQPYHHLSSTLRQQTRQQTRNPDGTPALVAAPSMLKDSKSMAMNPATAGGSLEVGGGSRRGSFRSSFRRKRNENADKKNANSKDEAFTNITVNVPLTSKFSSVPTNQQSNGPSHQLQRGTSPKNNDQLPLSDHHNSSILRRRQNQQARRQQAQTQHFESESPEKNDRFNELTKAPPTLKGWRNNAPSKRDSGLGRDSSLEEPVTSSNVNVMGGSGPHLGIHSLHPQGRHESSDTPDSGMSDISQLSKDSKRQRRRTLPSVMTTQPVFPVNPPVKTLSRTMGKSPRKPVAHETKESLAHSVDTLSENDIPIYIIENGIRQRVQGQSLNDSGASAFRKKRNSSQGDSPLLDLEEDELAPLPLRYIIEPQAQLAKDLGDGSLPDFSICRELKQQGLMSREEVTRMSQAQRHRRLLEEERRRRGQIVIRVADVKPPSPSLAELQCTLMDCSHCLRLQRDRLLFKSQQRLQRQGEVSDDPMQWFNDNTVSDYSLLDGRHSMRPSCEDLNQMNDAGTSSQNYIPLSSIKKQDAVDCDESSVTPLDSSQSIHLECDCMESINMPICTEHSYQSTRLRRQHLPIIHSSMNMNSPILSQHIPNDSSQSISLWRMASVITRESIAYRFRRSGRHIHQVNNPNRINCWDWLKRNTGFLMVILLNVILVIAFLYLLRDYEPISSEVRRPR